jgi:hypothetical protein
MKKAVLTGTSFAGIGGWTGAFLRILFVSIVDVLKHLDDSFRGGVPYFGNDPDWRVAAGIVKLGWIF